VWIHTGVPFHAGAWSVRSQAAVAASLSMTPCADSIAARDGVELATAAGVGAAARKQPADLSALAEGDLQHARRLYQHDQGSGGRRRRVGGGVAAAAAGRPNRDLRGFVARGGRLVPREMAAAEAWKRRQARQ
jgi:hypothetical protein